MAVLPPPAPDCASCAARDVVIAEQARLLEEQAEAVRELRADVVALAAEVRDLRRKLGRNSGNSSMAPSADDLPGRKAPAPGPKRGGGGRKPGGQPGRDGAHLEWRDDADDTVPPFPGGAGGAASRAATRAGMARPWNGGTIPTIRCRISPAGRARAARTWPRRLTWAWRSPIR